MTSYGGIIRIRLRVEVRLLPLSLLTQAPLYLFFLSMIHRIPEKSKGDSINCDSVLKKRAFLRDPYYGSEATDIN